MKITHMKKTIIAVVLAVVLTFSVLSADVLFAKADYLGVGKYLTVEIIGQGYVTVTKVTSGEVWNYAATNPPTAYKLGAGTVNVAAFADEGWQFSHWEDLNGNIVNTASSFNLKTEKYAFLRAVFIKKTFTITAIVYSEAANGTITTILTGETKTATSQQPLEVSVEYGESQIFTFNPYADNHVSTIIADNEFQPHTESYVFSNVTENHVLVVFFSLDGTAYIPAGSNVPVYLGNDVSLNFASTLEGGTATQSEIVLEGYLATTSLILWDVSVIEVSFAGNTTIALPYSGAYIQHIFTGESLDALYSDITADGVVNGDDVSAVAIGIKTTVSSGAVYNVTFDVNRDGELTEDDVLLVNQYKGTTLQELDFEVVGDTLYIYTPHFSIFRGR